MTLRNALDGLATETTTAAIEALIERIDARDALIAELLQRQSLMEQPRSLQYARTSADALRVNIDNTNYQVQMHPKNDATNGMNAQWLTWYGPSAGPGTVDERGQQSEQSMQTFNLVRTNRWVFS